MAFNKKKIYFGCVLSSWLFVKPLLGQPWYPGMSFGMLIQLNLVVILVMACYLNSMIHKMVFWQLDNLLCSTCKEENELELVTLGWVPAYNKYNRSINQSINLIDQFRYIKIQSQTIDLRTRLWGIKSNKLCIYSPEPRTEVYCLRLNFNISKLVYLNSHKH